MFLIPGDSPMGFRLPIQSLLWYKRSALDMAGYARDAFAERPELPLYHRLRERAASHDDKRRAAICSIDESVRRRMLMATTMVIATTAMDRQNGHGPNSTRTVLAPLLRISTSRQKLRRTVRRRIQSDPSCVVRTALCVEPRDGVLHIFMPPVDHLEDYLELVAAIEATAAELATPVVIEGYEPPHDARLSHVKVTPDPGVIEVNVPPAQNWDELVAITTGVYEDAHFSRLGTEKFDLDGSHTGTGGGNHVVLGGATTRRQPILAAARFAPEPRRLLAQPSVAVVFVLRHIHRSDQPGAAGRRRPARCSLRAGNRLRASHSGAHAAAVAGRPRVSPLAGRRHGQHASFRILHRQTVFAR